MTRQRKAGRQLLAACSNFYAAGHRDQIKKLEAENAELRAELERLHAAVVHWKSNHAAEVRRARVLKERKDMPLERVQAYENWQADLKELAELRAEVKRLRVVEQEYCRVMEAVDLCDEASRRNWLAGPIVVGMVRKAQRGEGE